MTPKRHAPRLILAVTLSAILAGCAATRPAATTPDATTPAGDRALDGAVLFVIDRGWHTDIALPSADASRAGDAAPFADLAQVFSGVRFLVFGFGDRVYYMAREATFFGTLAAAFPGPGVILVTGLSATPADAFGADHVIALSVTGAQLAAVSGFIRHALEPQPGGALQALGDGPYPGSRFYASSESYDLMHDCNWWTLAALASGGLPASPDGVIFADQTLGRVRRIAARR